MPKTISTALKSHLTEDATSLATCWKITRRDGAVFTFTDHDTDLVVDSLTYKAALGYSRSAVDNSSSLSVDNMNVEGFIDDDSVTTEDLRAGLYDRAEVLIFLVNWNDLTQGVVRLRKGWFGETTVKPSGVYTAELRGLNGAYAQAIIEVSTPECRADLGDHRCKLPISPAFVARSTAYALGDYVRVASIADPYDKMFRCVQAGTTSSSAVTYSNTIAVSTTDGGAIFTCENAWSRKAHIDPAHSTINQKVFACNFDALDARLTADALWYNGGVLTWLTGPNTGRSVEIKRTVNYGSGIIGFEVFLPLPFPFTMSDTFFIAPGCDKRYQATCIAKFNNRLNFRGEPFLPGQDFLTQYPDAR